MRDTRVKRTLGMLYVDERTGQLMVHGVRPKDMLFYYIASGDGRVLSDFRNVLLYKVGLEPYVKAILREPSAKRASCT